MARGIGDRDNYGQATRQPRLAAIDVSRAMSNQKSVRRSSSPLAPGTAEASSVWSVGAVTTVMLVEDHDDTRAFLKVLLESAGFHVIERHEGTGTVDAVTQTRPDAVLLNGRLRGEDGWSICRRIRQAEDPIIRDTPVVFIATVRGDGETRAFAAGCDMFVLKPFEVRDLVTSVTALIARRRTVH
jgi:CheY-like chemotaxis protein